MPNTLYDALFKRHETSDAVLLHLPDGATVSYRAFLALASGYSTTLSSIGLRPGDRLALQVEKSPEALAIYAACVRAGVIFLPLNTAYTPQEIAYFVEDAKPGVLICDPSAEVALAPVAKTHGARLATMDAQGRGSFNDLGGTDAPVLPPADRGPDDLAAFLYTSGTTGRSKGAMLSQGNLLSNAATLLDVWRFDASDVLLHALPIFHAHGLFVACNVMFLAGSSAIFLPRFSADEVLGHLANATTMMGVPTFYTRLLDTEGFDRPATEHMRLFISGSAPMLAQTHEAFEARTGQRILERYGMTETGMNTSNPYDGDRRAGSVGPPLPDVEVIVTDAETGVPLPQGEVGMIEVRGPNVFKGYWQMPDKTAQDLRKTGFLITGDLGRIDDDGYLWIVGRSKDLIISGGYNVYPKEVEQALDDQGDVVESAVIGVPHPDFGEAVVGVVVAADPKRFSPDALLAEVAVGLANYKRPKHIACVPELPRNTMGKVQKNLLREQFATLFDPGAATREAKVARVKP